ncbi:MAG: dihydrofolate reductase, partial [Pirellulales bacterium]|nr:dihydrofolate reductase [Pirellulales bacterium]
MPLSLIVAVAENNVIGYQGDLPWHLSTDLRRFKRLTMGHTMLIGRKTWESIGRRLPGRMSLGIWHQADYARGFQEVPTAL